jgi:hypothetical protein
VVGAVAVAGTTAGGSEVTPFLRMLAMLLFSLPVLLVLAALVPLNFEFVPYRVAHGWEELRAPAAIGGLSLLVVEGFMYLLTR